MMSWNPFKTALACCFVLCFMAAQANASINVGDLIRFQNGPGSPGGEFGIAHSATPNQTEFITFCTERNEYIDFSSNFYVESIQMTADAGGVAGGPQDPVDARTAWLYYNFRQGTLANYTSGVVSDRSSARVNSANALQNAVWFLEEEQNSAASGQNYVDMANAEWTLFTTSNNYSGNMQAAIDSVRIMNLRWHNANGARAQSQLFMVPEPASMAVWGTLGLFGLVTYRRRK